MWDMNSGKTETEFNKGVNCQKERKRELYNNVA